MHQWARDMADVSSQARARGHFGARVFMQSMLEYVRPGVVFVNYGDGGPEKVMSDREAENLLQALLMAQWSIFNERERKQMGT